MDSGKTYVRYATEEEPEEAEWGLVFTQDGLNGTDGGSINTSGGTTGTGGSINTSNGGGSINTSDGGGSINTGGGGGSINTGGGGSISTSGGGGAINTANGGGAINTANGGGAIDTRGTGSIQLGVTETRTTLNGSASGGNKTITLPNATGTIALTTHTHGNLTSDGKIGSTANLPLITTTSGVVTTGTFGTTSNTFCQGNDVRLGAQAIFTLGGEEKTSFALSTSYYYAGMLTKASKSFAQAFDSGNPTLGFRILGNWTIKAIAIHENLASSAGQGGISSATRTYKIVNLASSSVVTDLVTNMSITNGALFNVITLENQSVNISSGANLALVLTTGSSGNLPLSTGTTTISANIYCVPR
jgi:hypothetical protein